MNPNAPEHRPDVIRDVAVIRIASEKMFSEPDAGATEMINELIPPYDKLHFQIELIEKRNKLYSRQDPVPSYPLFTRTPSPEESNGTSKTRPSRAPPSPIQWNLLSLLHNTTFANLSVCTGIRLNTRQGLKGLDPDAGIPQHCTDAYLEFVCDFANQWHSKLSSIDCRSTGTDPKFYCLNSNFYYHVIDRSATWVANQFSIYHLNRKQFWKLRYLFIPISFKPNRDSEEPKQHVALCAISPEAKSLEYICSGKDNGLSNSERTRGSRFLPYIFEFLAVFLGTDSEEGFLPYEWKLRTPSGYEQKRERADCGIYTATHTMCLAFGWGIGNEGQFPYDHIAKMPSRRRRYVQDLMYRGFKFYEEGSDNYQYYPLLDRAPTASASDGFVMLPKEVLLGLPQWARNRRACYIDCPNKQLLKSHCRRNARFYPGYASAKVSGPNVTFREFLDWVEETDRMRKTHDYDLGRRPLPYPQFQPPHWIDPRDKVPKAVPPGPLWMCPYD